MMLSRIVKCGLAPLLLLCVLVPLGCGGGDTQPDATLPSEEVVGDNLCSNVQMAHAYLLDNSKIAVACGQQNIESSVYLLDEDTHTSTMIYDQAPSTFVIRAVVGDIMYMTPQEPPRQPELQALRLDAGATTPSVIVGSSLHGIGPLSISGTYAYWAWGDQQASGQPIYGLSRAPLFGGAEEEVTPLPFAAQQLAIMGEGVYALGYPSLEIDDYNISIIYISGSSRTPEIIFSEPKGARQDPWFGAYQDHVLWSDDSAVPTKIYEIHEAMIQPGTPMKCPPALGSILTGDLITSVDYTHCVSPNRLAVTATNLITEQISYSTDSAGFLVGARDGWIYMIRGSTLNTLSRVRTAALH